MAMGANRSDIRLQLAIHAGLMGVSGPSSSSTPRVTAEGRLTLTDGGEFYPGDLSVVV